MQNFLENIFAQLKKADVRAVLREIHGEQFLSVTGSELLQQVEQVRAFLRSSAVQPGDRCALLAANSIRWVAMDLALMAEGLIVVPLYSRQAPTELVGTMKDCTPSLVCCGDALLKDAIAQSWPEAPPLFLFDEIFVDVEGVQLERPQMGNDSAVTIIYTSGTSGDAKGVVLTAANVGFMLNRTAARLGELMAATSAKASTESSIGSRKQD